ncbi:unnamed protein product [Caenorhabditis angaria]|uniref:MADF domain-containing protein n=1 Tax=Caenorhabditis angaria TaxID=860376 RepID=A0A9P1IY94_9PELO|nr:unnamed protein product [Caenorhabditis angaria]
MTEEKRKIFIGKPGATFRLVPKNGTGSSSKSSPSSTTPRKIVVRQTNVTENSKNCSQDASKNSSSSTTPRKIYARKSNEACSQDASKNSSSSTTPRKIYARKSNEAKTSGLQELTEEIPSSSPPAESQPDANSPITSTPTDLPLNSSSNFISVIEKMAEIASRNTKCIGKGLDTHDVVVIGEEDEEGEQVEPDEHNQDVNKIYSESELESDFSSEDDTQKPKKKKIEVKKTQKETTAGAKRGRKKKASLNSNYSEYTREDIIFFLEFVRLNEEVWYGGSDDYHREDLKEVVWDEIERSCSFLKVSRGGKGENAKTLWKSLIVDYMKEKKKIPSSGSRAGIPKTFPYYHELEFFDVDIGKRNDVENVYQVGAGAAIVQEEKASEPKKIRSKKEKKDRKRQASDPFDLGPLDAFTKMANDLFSKKIDEIISDQPESPPQRRQEINEAYDMLDKLSGELSSPVLQQMKVELMQVMYKFDRSAQNINHYPVNHYPVPMPPPLHYWTNNNIPFNQDPHFYQVPQVVPGNTIGAPSTSTDLHTENIYQNNLYTNL